MEMRKTLIIFQIAPAKKPRKIEGPSFTKIKGENMNVTMSAALRDLSTKPLSSFIFLLVAVLTCTLDQ